MNLTENEYNLVVYCLEQQMYEFNKDGQNDANNIVMKGLYKGTYLNCKSNWGTYDWASKILGV